MLLCLKQFWLFNSFCLSFFNDLFVKAGLSLVFGLVKTDSCMLSAGFPMQSMLTMPLCFSVSNSFGFLTDSAYHFLTAYALRPVWPCVWSWKTVGLILTIYNLSKLDFNSFSMQSMLTMQPLLQLSKLDWNLCPMQSMLTMPLC
jgi:hypothetical protein